MVEPECLCLKEFRTGKSKRCDLHAFGLGNLKFYDSLKLLFQDPPIFLLCLQQYQVGTALFGVARGLRIKHSQPLPPTHKLPKDSSTSVLLETDRN